MHVKVLNQLLVRAYTHKRTISYKKTKIPSRRICGFVERAGINCQCFRPRNKGRSRFCFAFTQGDFFTHGFVQKYLNSLLAPEA